MLEQFIPEYILNYTFLNNTAKDYIIAVVAFIVILIVCAIFQKAILAKLKKLTEKTKNDIDDTFVKIISSLKPPFYVYISIWFALRLLTINGFAQKAIDAILIVWVTYQTITAVQILIDYIAEKKFTERDSKNIIELVSRLSKGLLWLFGILIILSNLGINITSLIAGLGIGGVAVALALQNILGDLFSSFAIYLDKPFVVGDLIVIDGEFGNVEKIGIKTTRIRSLTGQEIVISNQQLTSKQIHNFKRMEKRRIVFEIGVTYDTPTEKLEKIPKIIESIMEPIEKAEFSRAHFKSFGDSALMFEIVYFVVTREYQEYMDINQHIHLNIKKEFDNENIEFAFPTQTIHLQK